MEIRALCNKREASLKAGKSAMEMEQWL